MIIDRACRSLAISAAILATSSAGYCFTPQRGPERQSVSLEAVCFGRPFLVVVDTDQAGISRLRSVSSGETALMNDTTRAIASHLPTIRYATPVAISCQSSEQAGIAFSGSRLVVAPGEEDDVLRWFPLDLASRE